MNANRGSFTRNSPAVLFHPPVVFESDSNLSKAFTKETAAQDDDDDEGLEPSVPAGFKNYIRPSGLKHLKDELLDLLDNERPEMVKIVSWAASNGDRSENGDYLYGKKRLREIDRRIRFLTKRIDSAALVDPNAREATDQIFFGATVAYEEEDGTLRTITIVGVDEVAMQAGFVSWISPVATALLKAREGDSVQIRTPLGLLPIDILKVSYTEHF